MKIKMKNYARHLWLLLLLLVGVTAIAVPGLNGTNESSVARIGETEYATLQAAVDAAGDGATIQVIKAGEYAIPAITNNLTIEGDVDGVVVKHEANSAITTIASGKTATFKNITFDLGTLQLPTAHGFGTLSGSNGALEMDGCTINGALNLFGESTFTNCKFNAEGIYNIWAVNDNATLTGCTFTNTNRAVNVYDQKKSSTTKNVSFSNCTFAGSAKKKAAVNIHHNADPVGTAAKYAVSITNCTTSGTWASTVEETGEPDGSTICYSPLWMISDIVNWEDGDITVTVDGKAQDVSKFSPVAKIGETKYTSLEAAVDAAEDGATIKVVKAGEYTIPAITKNLTIEGDVDGVVVKHEANSAITTIASGKTATFQNITFDLGTLQLPTAHGFGTLSGSNGALVMDGCTINGALNLFGESTFTNCKFNAEGIYNIWAVNDNATLTGCTFTNTNRAVNVYDQKKSSTTKNVSFSNCTFAGSAKKKAAVNIHHNPDPVGAAAKYAVSINDCTTSDGTWASTVEETGEPDGSTICYSPLWMISDIVNWEDGDITVTVDGKAQDVSKFSPVARIGEEQYYSLADAFTAATDGQTITVLTDIDLPSTINVTKQVTLDLAKKKIFNTSDLWGGDNWSFFSVQANGNLTVTGNGTIDAKENDCYSFDVRNGGILTIKDGTYTGNISCVYLYNKENIGVSTCNIEGGTFSIKQLADESGDRYRFLLNCYDASYASNTVKFNVTGGSFVNFNPANNLAEGAETNFCAAGYEAVQDGNVWTVQKAAVAKIGETKYYSLADAFEAAQAGQTITVLTDIDLPSTIAVTKQVTLDLAGKTISNTSDLWAGGNWSFFSVQATGNLTVTGNGTIDAKENDCFTFDVRDGGILTIKDGTYTGNISSVYLINEAGTGVSTCNIEGGTFSIKQIDGTSGYNFLLNCLDASYKNNTAKFNVTGGSFVKFNPANNQAEGTETNFCAAGYEAVQDGDVWTVQKAPVAKIDDEMYYSLADAFAAATEGETITLLKDVELADRLFVNAGATPAYAGTNNRYATTTENKSITLDLNGNNITTSSNIALAGGGLNIVNNGTADADHGVISTTNAGLAPIEIRGTGDLTQKRTLTVGTGVTLSGAEYGLNVFGSNDEQKNVIDVNVNGTVNGTLFVLGNLKNAENNIVVNVNGSVVSATDAGIALNGNAKVNVAEGASVTGLSGIEVRAGELNVAGGTIKATAEEYSYNANGSGTTTKGAAIAVAQHNTVLPVTVTANGGTLEGTKTIAVVDVNNNQLENVTVKAKDELVADKTEIPAAFAWVSDGAGMSTLTPIDPVAKIGETVYYSLASAIAAVPNDGTETTITLLADVTENAVVKDGKKIVLDLGEKTLTGYIDQYDGELNVKNGTLAGTVYVNGGPASAEAGYNKFTLAADATITSDWGFILYQGPNGNDAYGSVIDINGTVNGTAWVMGNIKEGNSVINVNNGAKIQGSVFGLNGLATLNVKEGATIIGSETGIEVRAGNLNVEGGTITSTATEYSVNPNGSGTTTTGAAIAIAQHTTGLPINANIKGGTLSGPKTISVADPQGLNYAGVVVTAKDELTEGDVVIPDGYIWVSNGDGTSTLTKIEDGEYKLIDRVDYPFMNLKSNINVPEVTYQRSFSETQVDKHQAWYVPMDYTITAEDAENFTFYKLHMVAGAAEAGEADPNQIYLYVTPMNVGEKLVGNRPYTVKPKAAKDNYIFTAENTILYAPNNGSRLNVTTSTHSYDFFGQYENTNYSGNKGDMYYLSQGALHPNNPTTSLLPYRWNIKVSSNNINDGYSKIEFVIVEDGDATGIDGVRGFNADEVEGIYTINGLKLDEPVKGINIIKYKNGKTEKRIIK